MKSLAAVLLLRIYKEVRADALLSDEEVSCRGTMLPSLVLLVVLPVVLLNSSVILTTAFKPTTTTTASLPTSLTDRFKTVITELASEPLKNDNVLVVLDPSIVDELDFNLIFQTAFNRTKSYSVLTWDMGLVDDSFPHRFIRGSYLTVIIIYKEDPISFIDEQYNSWVWNPDYLILFSLNKNVDSEKLAEHQLVQRSKFILSIEPTLKQQQFILYNVLHNTFRKETTKSLRRPRGHWDKQVFSTKSQLFLWKKTNFGGAIIELASFCDDFPFMYHDDQGACVGAGLEILDILANKLNFTYVVQDYPEDGMWGSWENGSWTGMLADLAYNNKQLIINNFLLTEKRYQGFDVSYPYFSEGFNFLIKIPPPVPKWKGLLYPFTGFVWITFITVTVVIGALLILMLQVVPNKQSYDTVFLLMVGGLTRQSYPCQFSGLWLHQFVMCWWWLGFIISLAYTCNLVAFLTVTVPNKRIETIDELAASPLRVIMEDYGNFVPEALKLSQDKSLAHLGAEMELFTYEQYGSFAYPRVQAATHALINGEAFNTYLRKVFNQTETTYLMKEVLYPSYLCYYLRKNTPQTDVLSENLHSLVEAAIVRKLYKKHMLKDELPPTDLDLQPLGLEQLSGAFVLGLVGYGLALLVLVAEVVCRRCGCQATTAGRTGDLSVDAT